jgi:hypothetical protein
MAGARKKAEAASDGPAVGDVYLMSLADGRYGVCRVIGEQTQKRKRYFLVVASPWIGRNAPALTDPRLRKVFKPTHHSWKGEPAILWVDAAVPPEFRKIGMIKPTPRECSLKCAGWGGWQWIPIQLHGQWRWDHDREAVLREDDFAAERLRQEYEAADAERKKVLSGLSLRKIRSRKWFAEWRIYVTKPLILACRLIFSETVNALIALGPKAPAKEKLKLLQACIERLNRLDAENNHFIEATLREDLRDAFDEVVHACGLGHKEDLADRWRDW